MEKNTQFSLYSATNNCHYVAIFTTLPALLLPKQLSKPTWFGQIFWKKVNIGWIQPETPIIKRK